MSNHAQRAAQLLPVILGLLHATCVGGNDELLASEHEQGREDQPAAAVPHLAHDQLAAASLRAGRGVAVAEFGVAGQVAVLVRIGAWVFSVQPFAARPPAFPASLCLDDCGSEVGYRLEWPELDSGRNLRIYEIDGSGVRTEGLARADVEASVPRGSYVPEACLTSRCALTEAGWSGQYPWAVVSSFEPFAEAQASTGLASVQFDPETGNLHVCEVALSDVWHARELVTPASLIGTYSSPESRFGLSGRVHVDLWRCREGAENLACSWSMTGEYLTRAVDSRGCACAMLREVEVDQSCFDVLR